jgi:TRAP-type C4-dicarboxylate transport system substrate-binding protein
MKKISIIAGLLTTIFAAFASAGHAKPVVLKMVTVWPVNAPQSYFYGVFIKMVNERAEKQGIQVRIDGMGGPEIVAPMQLFEAMRTGIVDVGLSTGGYYNGECPELSAAGVLPFNKEHLKVLHETNFQELVNGACRDKSKVIVLAQAILGGYTLMSTKPVKGADWSGLKVRVYSKQTAAGVEGLGGASVFMPPAEVFTALQKGIIDATIRSPVDAIGFGERNIYKYIVEPSCSFGEGHIYMSARAWDPLPEETKAFLKDVSRDIENMAFQRDKEQSEKALDVYVKEDGVKIIQLSPEDQKKVAKVFRADFLDFLAQKSPKYGTQIRDLLKDYIW